MARNGRLRRAPDAERQEDLWAKGDARRFSLVPFQLFQAKFFENPARMCNFLLQALIRLHQLERH